MIATITILSALAVLAVVAAGGLFAMFMGASWRKGGEGLVVIGILIFLFASVGAVTLLGWWFKQ